jgi:hypothetical protein
MATDGVTTTVSSDPAPRLLDGALALAVLGAAACYLFLAGAFFPNAQGRLGHDYEYFLPLLLAGKYWIAENGVLAAPYFSPAFCGGLPLLANPQSIFYSVPQLLSLGLSPVTSVFVTTLIFAGIGAIGTFALLRQRFDASTAAASLAAVIFLFNGMLLHRMAIGHVTYHVLGLLPALCYVLLTPLPPGRSPLRAVLPLSVAAAMLAYVVYAGAANFAVPMGMVAVIVWLLHALLRKPVASFWPVGAGAALLAAVIAAAKLAPAAVLLMEFPRFEPLRIFDSAGAALYGLYLGLFVPWQLPDEMTIVLRHEMELGVGLVPLLLVAAATAAAILRSRAAHWARLAMLRRTVPIALIGLLLALPLWLNVGDASHAAFLRSLPYIGQNVVLVRWFAIYLLPLTLAAGLLLDFVVATAMERAAAAVIGMLLTVVPALAADRSYYDRQAYVPDAILAADRMLRTDGAVPAVSRIGAEAMAQRNDGLTVGATSYPCYEPLFGYEMEAFPSRLQAGLLQRDPATPQQHLRNPACYLYGRENGCAPGDAFGPEHSRDEALFATYRSFDYVIPPWQRWANRASLAGVAALVIVMGRALGRRGLVWVRRRRVG